MDTTHVKPKEIQGIRRYDIFSLGSIVLILSALVVFNFEFRTPIFSGFIIAVLTYPLMQFLSNLLPTKILNFKFNKNQLKNFSSIFVVVSISTIILIVLSLISTRLTYEVPKFATQIYDYVNAFSSSKELESLLNSFNLKDKININQVQEKISELTASSYSVDNIQRLLNIGQQLLNILFSQIVYFIIFLIAWINALIFGADWVNTIIDIFPLELQESKAIKTNLVVGIRNVIYANLLAGTLNGLTVFLIMVIFGLPNPLLLGLLTFLIGFLPITPSELGYIYPIALISANNPIIGIILIVAIELFILWQNYVFLPKIVLTGTNGNPLFLITSVITSIVLFGIMGFIIGPAIMIFINTLGSILSKRLYLNQD
jgi:predicted PurR-regulated permease PerM